MSELLDHLSEKAVSDYDRLRDDCGLLELTGLARLELMGDDRKGWLQGQATNDVKRFENGNSSEFCLCSVTGHLEAVVQGWALPDRFALTCDAADAVAVVKRVADMVIMEDVLISDVSKSFRIFSVQGPSATKGLGELVDLPSLDAGEREIEGTPVRVCRSNRTGMGGWDLWIPSARRKVVDLLRERFGEVSAEAAETAMLEAGVPASGRDYDARTLPPELGSAFEARHISYSKGCYMGQEVLMRIHSRGHTNRKWVGLLSDTLLEVGAKVSHPSRPDAGFVTRVAFSPDYGPIAAAMLRNEAAEDRDEVTVTTSSGVVNAEVRRMPILRLG
ncbi:MAG TPA: glycine cleavage T C-terminal barrel domain-containing protein [Fimbriimonas sp.]|nr:glycine cleavage T C-terminal barrel domain-containing protein [Fimbriimonas sp.]